MRCVTDKDLSGYAREVLLWLYRDPVVNNVACTLIEQRLDGAVPTEPDALWLRVLDDAGRLTGIALQTPPWGLLISELTRAGVDAVALSTTDRRPILPSVNGPGGTSAAFAARYAELTGAAPAPGMSQRLYRLDRVRRPSAVPGRLRAATEADRDVLLEWTRAFAAETAPDASHRLDESVDSHLRHGDLMWLWEAGGHPVSMAWLNRPAAGVVRISGVYTPSDLRGRGYASGCVAAVSQLALDRGATACMLYTDLANPTSNAIYQRLGYRPVTDMQMWNFTLQPAVGEAG